MSLILPSYALAAELAALFPKLEGPADRYYVCPTMDWGKRFGEWTAPLLQARRAQAAEARARLGGEGADEGDDCDDGARWTMEQAHDALRKNVEFMRMGYGFAVGFARVFINDGEILNGITGDGFDHHATNIIRYPEGWFLFQGDTGQHELALAAVQRGACVLHFGWV